MKNIFYVIVFSVIVFSSCKKDEDISGPVACIDVNNSIGTYGKPFAFSSCSQNAIRFEWDFGDATNSNMMNPSHVYDNPGTYNVRLTAFNANGIASTASVIITVGHYSLSKVTYHYLCNRVAYPKLTSLTYWGPNFSFIYSYSTNFFDDPSQLPITYELNDDSVYDLYPFNIFTFEERDNIDQTTDYVSPFQLNNSDIINGKVEKYFDYAGASAHITLYFKVTPR